MKILLVEDNAKIRQMIKQILQKNPGDIQEIIECEDGEKAFDLYSNCLPGWVLMDINIPVVDGLQASENILSVFPDARIIIVTMYDEPEYRHLAERLGVRDYVLKDDLLKIPGIIKLRGEKDEA